MLSEDKFYDKAKSFALYPTVDNSYFTFDELIEKTKDSQTDIEDTSYKRFIENFPAEQLWRLFVDLEKQKKESGYIGFLKREPKYLECMAEAWKYIFQSKNYTKYSQESSESLVTSPVNTELLMKIHNIAAEPADRVQGNNGKIRDKVGVSFGLIPDSTLTPKGEVQNRLLYSLINQKSTELTNRSAIDTSTLSLSLYKGYQNTSSSYLTSNEISMLVDHFCNEYEKELLSSKCKESKLYSLVKLVKTLELIHPFSDGNCRTICILLLNKELVRNGFKPVILEDPNQFDGHTIEELVQKVKEGMQNTEQVMNNEPLYNYSNDKFEEDNIEAKAFEKVKRIITQEEPSPCYKRKLY